MSTYTRILLAADFGENYRYVARRAVDLATRYGAELSLIHVVENIPTGDAGYGPIVPFEIDLTEQLVEAAEKRMTELGEELQVPVERVRVEVGSPKHEIIRVAEENAVDLIVVGSHGRHGIGLLLGSTASSVLHHAKCDVLAVRLKDE
ncbi:MAG: universal stress protein [Methylococcaceae bacterium]|nr:universal stress protein [Methylococcaceae bacterium]